MLSRAISLIVYGCPVLLDVELHLRAVGENDARVSLGVVDGHREVFARGLRRGTGGEKEEQRNDDPGAHTRRGCGWCATDFAYQ
jgi:hypothetical protein